MAISKLPESVTILRNSHPYTLIENISKAINALATKLGINAPSSSNTVSPTVEQTV